MDYRAQAQIRNAAADALSSLGAIQRTAECLDRAAESLPGHAGQLHILSGRMWSMAGDARQVETAIAEVYAALRDPQEPDNSPAIVEVVDGRRPRVERVLDVIRAAAAPITPEEILAELNRAGDMTASAQAVMNALTALTNRGAVQRPERGHYITQQGSQGDTGRSACS